MSYLNLSRHSLWPLAQAIHSYDVALFFLFSFEKGRRTRYSIEEVKQILDSRIMEKMYLIGHELTVCVQILSLHAMLI